MHKNEHNKMNFTIRPVLNKQHSTKIEKDNTTHQDSEQEKQTRQEGSYKTTRHHMPEDGVLHSQCCENLKSYTKKMAHACILRE
jgi:hypothetical protein